MDFLNAIRGPFVYLDTNIFIYALEAYVEYVSALTALFNAIDQGQFTAVTSELTLAECLVRPLIDQNTARQENYKQVLQSSAALRVVPISRNILIDAAQARASSNLRLPDAIQASTCLRGMCETFLTNDPAFRSVPGLPVVVLSEIISP